MKSIYLLLALIMAAPFFAQKKKKTKKELTPAVFIKRDGSQFEALLQSYSYPNGTLPNFLYDSDIIAFRYRTSPEAKAQDINGSEIQKVLFLDEYEDEILGLERLNTKAVTVNGDIVDKAYDSFQPLLYDGKIKVYGSNMLSCSNQGGCMYAYTKFFLKNHKSDFAIMPIDYDRINLFNIGKMDDKMVDAFKYAGNNCSNFDKYLEKTLDSKNKQVWKSWKEDFKAARSKGITEANEMGLKGVDAQKHLGNSVRDFYLKFYVGLIGEYEKNCP